MIGVKRFARDPVFAGADFFVANLEYFGMAGRADVLVVLRHDGSEDFACLREIRRGHFLVAKHQHMILGEGRVERLARRVVDRRGQVEPDNLRAGLVAGQRVELVTNSVLQVLLLDARAGIIDDLGPAREFGFHISAELFGRVADRIGALVDQALPDVGRFDDFANALVQQRDDGFR